MSAEILNKILFYLTFWNSHLSYIHLGIHPQGVQSMRGGLILKTTQMYARFQNGGRISLKAHMVFQYSASCFGVLIFPTAMLASLKSLPTILYYYPCRALFMSFNHAR
ncbi:hypothetical protein ACVWZV_009234 [Bradyrhizobium sp. GM5.1]